MREEWRNYIRRIIGSVTICPYVNYARSELKSIQITDDTHLEAIIDREIILILEVNGKLEGNDHDQLANLGADYTQTIESFRYEKL